MHTYEYFGTFTVVVRRKAIWAIFVVCLVLCSSCSFMIGPGDEYRSHISLKEAQSLAPFVICFPNYLPPEINVDPSINYHAEMGDSQDSDIRLRYFQMQDQKPIVEIFQKKGQADLNQYYEDNSSRRATISQLIDWAVGQTKAQETVGGVDGNMTTYQDDLKYWVSEITKPEGLPANMIEWTDGSKLYRVYTRLNLAEAKKIARSLMNCTAPIPKATPEVK